MFSWFRGYSWNRRTRWTPLLENQRAFQRTLAKERSRVDRNGNCFGFIILRLEDLRAAKAQTVQLAKLLHQRLRDTDEKGHLGYGRIGVMLPETGAVETEFVMHDLLSLAARQGMNIDAEALVYPDRDEPGSYDNQYMDEEFDVPGGAQTLGSDVADSGLTTGPRISRTTNYGSDAVLSSSRTMATEGVLTSGATMSSRGDVGSATAVLTSSPKLTSAFRVDASEVASPTGALAATEIKLDPAVAKAVERWMMPRYPLWKRSMDIAGALTGLAAGGPLLVAAAAMIKLTSPGPVLFCQDRTGYMGKTFKIYKLRSMVINAEELKSALDADNERDGPAFKMRKDPRITTVGRFLRATGLDELPQLVNVLRGDMAIVGPRPLPVDEASQCSAWQQRRQEVRPGLTCFWQIAKSRRISFQDWMRLDRQYARQQSFGLDVKLVLRTVASVIMGRVGH